MISRRWGLAACTACVLTWAAPAAAADAALDSMRTVLAGVTEEVQTLRAKTGRLEKLGFSGYVQARYEVSERSDDTVRVVGSPPALSPANHDRFYIRRARLKLTYDAGPLSQAVVYFDGGEDREIRLLEGFVTLRDPWTDGHRHALTIGQMNVPFGWELERSSGTRELPERSRAENVLFRGERDRGAKIVSRWTDRLETVVGLFNGGGIRDAEFPETDPTRAKDVVARARWARGPLAGAVSWYGGTAIVPLTGDDVEADRTRLGLDAQWRFRLPTAGKGMLAGEFYRGENANADSIRKYVTVVPTATAGREARLLAPGADPGRLTTDVAGGYVMAVQHLGDRLQAVVRWDWFDPNLDADHDQYERWGLGLNWFHDTFTRVTLACDVPRTDVASGSGYDDPKDNLWTLQVQHKF